MPMHLCGATAPLSRPAGLVARSVPAHLCGVAALPSQSTGWVAGKEPTRPRANVVRLCCFLGPHGPVSLRDLFGPIVSFDLMDESCLGSSRWTRLREVGDITRVVHGWPRAETGATVVWELRQENGGDSVDGDSFWI
ncbi:hypothetical protein TIFTF001_028550 [Ficus carica]|uniref:Uncharacterized protein n=1 Tax=Ficus carica TaxID=3494 RepID=A0AA88DQ72_FICCA|nr:hypothetical protein TIFTF001_028550 [Ficus carica]